MKPKVVVAEKIAQAGIDSLAATCDVEILVDQDRPALLAAMSDAAGLIVRSATKVDAELIAAAPALQVVGRAGIGVDNIDVDAATQAGVLVVNAPQANVISAAEHTMALLLAQARRVTAADASMRRGEWERKQFQGVELHGKVLGIVGLGRIGTLVAQRASSFGMKLIAYDPYVSADRARRLGVDVVPLEELFATADFVTVHLPLTRETEHLIDGAAFGRMQPGVRIVNTSRGGIIDEHALAEAIRSGIVAGAALDVFAEEPLGESPLRDLAEVVLTPHLGASTQEAQDKAGTAVAEAVAQALAGELVLSAVNVDMGQDVSDELRPFLPVAQSLGEIFVSVAHGLPEALIVHAEGKLADFAVRPLTLAALKGALARVSDVPVSFVNAPHLARERGVEVTEESSTHAADYQSAIRLTGTVAGTTISIAGSLMGRKGPVLVEALDHEIELPLTRYLLLVRNQDVPGVIGRVGTYLGDARVNIANMVVGRDQSGEAAMMGLNLDSPLSDAHLAALHALEGISDAQFIELSAFA